MFFKSLIIVLTSSILGFFAPYTIHAYTSPQVQDTLPFNPNPDLGVLIDQLKEDSIELGSDFEQLNKARSLLSGALDKTKFIDKIVSGSWLSLPIMLQKTIHNVKYTMAVSDVLLTSAFIQASVYVGIQIPQKGKVLYFGAPDIKFSNTGGIVGDARLGLLADYAIHLGGHKSLLILKGMYGQAKDKGCFVRIDCDGFKDLSLDAEVLFSRDLVIPVDATGNPRQTGRVKGRFSLICSDWNDILTSIQLPNFAMAGYRDIAFELNTAVIDLSDIRNDRAVVFPDAYTDPALGGIDVTWRGVYVNSLSVILPPPFKKRGAAGRLNFATNHLLLDHSGVSGQFFAGNLMTSDEGAMNKWSYSLDTVFAGFVKNRIKGFGFDGTIRIPIANNKKKQGIDYGAFMDEGGKFTFNASIKDHLQFPVFQAGRVSIEKNSIVHVTVDKQDFYPEAILHGDLTIGASTKGDKLESPDTNALFYIGKVRFESLHLRTDLPYLTVSKFDLSTGSMLAKFPVTISHFKLDVQGTRSAMTIGMAINLVPEKETAFGLKTVAKISGDLDIEEGTQQWKFKKFELDALCLHMAIKNFKLDGCVYIFEDHPDYGTGFQGNLAAELTITLDKKVQMSSTALFGRTTDFRYWYADGLVSLTPGINLGGGLRLSGLGGGAYRKMKMASYAKQAGGLGVTTSGIKYIPDASIGLGILAVVNLNFINPSAFNATATLEMAFNNSGGLNQMSIRGTGEFIAKVDFNLGLLDKIEARIVKLVSLGIKDLVKDDNVSVTSATGAVRATVFFNIDHTADVIQGNMAIYVDLAKGTMRGAAQEGGSMAGAADLYLSDTKWHIYLGSWDQKLSIALQLGALQGYAGAYFMMGNDLGAPPPLDAKIVRELGLTSNQLSEDRNKSAASLVSGSGFALGANAHIIYHYAKGKTEVHIAAGAGFEIYCIDYGRTAGCSNLSSEDRPIGANGWRAGGKIYAFANVSARWRFIRGSAGLALLIQADIPNPNQFQADFKIIGIKFGIESGEPCHLVQ